MKRDTLPKNAPKQAIDADVLSAQSQFLKSEGGGQFFKLLSEYEVKVISLYDFNPIIERRRLSPTIIAQLKCVPCTQQEFESAEREAAKLLGLCVLPQQIN